MVGIVLLVACANVMGMLLARGAARRREIAVRLAVGASRGRVVRQLLTESLVLSSLGAAAGLALAWSVLYLLAGVEAPIPLPISWEFALDGRAFLFTAAVAAGAGVLAGLVPALDATRRNLVRDVNGAVATARAGGRRWLLRDALVAAQLAVTVPLLVIAGLLARGTAGVTADVSLGFEADRVAAVDTDLNVIGYDDRRGDRFLRDVLERVRSMPGVEAAALASRAPLDLSSTRRVVLVPDVHGSAEPGDSMDTAAVSADYFDTLGVPLLEGRTFTTADTPESPRVAVVSETMARRYWPDETAVGRRFRLEAWDGVEYEIVGVSADYRVRFPTELPRALPARRCLAARAVGRRAPGPHGRRRGGPRRGHPPRAAAERAGHLLLSPGRHVAREGQRHDASLPGRGVGGERVGCRGHGAGGRSASMASSPSWWRGGRASSRSGRRWAPAPASCCASCWPPAAGWSRSAWAVASSWPSRRRGPSRGRRAPSRRPIRWCGRALSCWSSAWPRLPMSDLRAGS